LLAGHARIESVRNLQRIDDRQQPTIGVSRLVVKALRPHQWLKNTLVFIPALAAHRFDASTAEDVLVAFLSLSLCASGGYVLNDLLDVSSDRRHARKQLRPFASGRLSASTGVWLIVATWTVGLGLAAGFLPAAFTMLTLAYLLTTSAYSIVLKRTAVLDVMVLAALYVVRVIAGGVASTILVSSWLLAFTLFVSLSLAFLKRFIEIRAIAATQTLNVPGRGYQTDDAAWLHSAGLTSAYLGVVVLALYANSSDVTRLYAHPERLLLVCPFVLYWATRTWLLAHRGQLHDDPVVAVARDPVTYIVLALSAVSVLVSI
jgi:4-hydroxybenzoate polyprenyltransferase